MRGRTRFWMLLWLTLASACERGGDADSNANPTATTSTTASPPPTVSEPVLAEPAPEPPQPQPKATVTRDASRAQYLDDAVSNDRNRMNAAKNAIKFKKARGEATQQDEAILRGLCRQLGDMSCAR